MVPPELLELTLCLYSSDSSNASEERVNARHPQRSRGFETSGDYLMKRVSRSWSRPTNDFIEESEEYKQSVSSRSSGGTMTPPGLERH